MFDLVINNGMLIDPETLSRFPGSIAVSSGRIAAISHEALNGKVTLDAAGFAVSPGFIDIHAHKEAGNLL